MTNTNPLNNFGKILIESIRDRGIEQNEMLMAGRCKAPSLLPMQSRIQALSAEHKQLLRDVVNVALTAAIHDFLSAIDEASSAGTVLTVDGTNLSEISDGLAGELFGCDGWLANYSKFPLD